ncbi:MAG: hypothetical protein AAF465_08085, partial [Pseudomonadota bacterium]
MAYHVIYAAPFFMDATLRFLSGATHLPDTHLTVVSQDPAEKIPAEIRARIAGHWRIQDGLDPVQLAEAAQHLTRQFGQPTAYLATLEQLQVPLALAREALGIPGLSSEASRNFRDKSTMKDVLRAAGLPCARHALIGSVEQARAFLDAVGLPVVVKPPDGAGGKATYRLETATDAQRWLQQHPLHPDRPTLFEEFIRGQEYSFDSV